MAEDSPKNRPTPSELPEFSLDEQRAVPFDGRFLRPGALVGQPHPHMSLLEAIGTRRTSRAYAEQRVPRALLQWLVAHAMHAPTACNEQQWKLIDIDDPAVIHDLYERGSASFLLRTGQCFLLCYNRRSDNRHWHDHVQSGAAFITTFQLLAHSVGVGSCWIGHLPNKGEIRKMFGIPRSYEPIALVSYGYYRSKVKVLPRKRDPADVIMQGRFRPERLHLAPVRRTILRTIGRWLYYRLPVFVRRRLRELTKPYEKKFYDETFD